MDAIFSWFQRAEKVQFMAIDGRSLTFKSPKKFKVGSQPTILISIPNADGGTQDFKLPVRVNNVRQVGPGSSICTGDVPGAAQNIEQLRQILSGLDAHDDTEDDDATRRARRYNWSIRVLSKDLPGFRAVSLDFNRLGMKLSTEGPADVGAVIAMALEVETAKTQQVICQGVVRWSKELARRKYELGIEFTDLHPEVTKELVNFESFLETRMAGDVGRKSVMDSSLFSPDEFGPGVEGMEMPGPPEPLEEAAEEEVKIDIEALRGKSAEDSTAAVVTPATESTATEAQQAGVTEQETPKE